MDPRPRAGPAPPPAPEAIATPHLAALTALGLGTGACRALAAYLDLLAAWNLRVNLTGARTPAERVLRLVAPVAPWAATLESGRLVDVGSGNGSPGLVLALLRPDLSVTLLEPRQKRWAFLREAARVTGRPDVDVRRIRHDGDAGGPARTVTLRALSLPLADLLRLVEPGGRLIVWGRRPQGHPAFRPDAGPTPGVHAFRRAA